MGEITQKFTTWSIGAAIVNKTKEAIADMVQQVFDLDASLVEFNKVTDVTPEQLQQITNEAYKLGEQLARTGWNKILARSI